MFKMNLIKGDCDESTEYIPADDAESLKRMLDLGIIEKSGIEGIIQRAKIWGSSRITECLGYEQNT